MALLNYLFLIPRLRHAHTRPARSQRPKNRRHLLLEVLEDRCVPSTLTVTSSADDVTQKHTLRYAVAHAQDGDTIQLTAAVKAPILVFQFRAAVLRPAVRLLHSNAFLDLRGLDKGCAPGIYVAQHQRENRLPSDTEESGRRVLAPKQSTHRPKDRSGGQCARPVGCFVHSIAHLSR